MLVRLRERPSGRRSPGAPWRSRRPRKYARRRAPFQSLDLLATAATSGGELLLEAGDLGAARRRRGALGVERRLQRRGLVARGRRRLLRDDARRIRVQRRLLGRGTRSAARRAGRRGCGRSARRGQRLLELSRVPSESNGRWRLAEFFSPAPRRLALLERCLGLRRALASRTARFSSLGRLSRARAWPPCNSCGVCVLAAERLYS